MFAEPAVGNSRKDTGYVSLDLCLMRVEATRGFDLYVLQGKSYLLYSAKGELFTETVRQRLADLGVRYLYVRESEREALQEYLGQNLGAIIQDPELGPEEKAQAVYKACLHQLERLWEAPTAEAIEEAKRVIRATVDHILSCGAEENRRTVHSLAHDPCVYPHSVNVGMMGTVLAREVFGDADRDFHALGYAMFLHDIGKTRVDPRILNKPGPLNDAEWQIMRQHPEICHRILEEEGHLTPEAAITTLQHHERCDGRGYPNGLGSGEIDPLAKICNLVDSYDALLAKRPYKPALSPYEALRIMREEMCAQFDVDLFAIFVQLLR